MEKELCVYCKLHTLNMYLVTKNRFFSIFILNHLLLLLLFLAFSMSLLLPSDYKGMLKNKSASHSQEFRYFVFDVALSTVTFWISSFVECAMWKIIIFSRRCAGAIAHFVGFSCRAELRIYSFVAIVVVIAADYFASIYTTCWPEKAFEKKVRWKTTVVGCQCNICLWFIS